MSLTKSPYGLYVSSFTKPAELIPELKAKVIATNRGWEIPGAGSFLPGVKYASHSLDAYEVVVPVPNLNQNHVYLLDQTAAAPATAASTFAPGTKVYSETAGAGTEATILNWIPFHAKKYSAVGLLNADTFVVGAEVEYRTANTLSTGTLVGKGIVLQFSNTGGTDTLIVQVTEGNFEKPASPNTYYVINKTTPANVLDVAHDATFVSDVGALITTRQVDTVDNSLFVGATDYSTKVLQLGAAATSTSYRQTAGLHGNGWVYPATAFGDTTSLGSVNESANQTLYGETTYEFQKNDNAVGFGISVGASGGGSTVRFSPGFGIWKLTVTPAGDGSVFNALTPGSVIDGDLNHVTTTDFNATVLSKVGNTLYVYASSYNYKLVNGSSIYTNVSTTDDLIGTLVSQEWVTPSDPNFVGVYPSPNSFVAHGLVVTNTGTAKLPVGTVVSYVWGGITYSGTVVATSFNDGADTESFALLTNSPYVVLATSFTPAGQSALTVHSTHNPVLRPGGRKSVTLVYYGAGLVSAEATITYTVSGFEYDNADLDGTSTGSNTLFTKTIVNVP